MNRETTIYGQLMESIRNKIISGDLKIGDRLESERTMSEKYGINRMTVRKALKYLENEGVLESRRGSGTYVSKMPLVQGKLSMDDSNHTLSLSALIRQRGMKSTRMLLSMSRVLPRGDVAMVYPEERKVYEIVRLSLINDRPYALQKVYIPCSLFNDAERFDFEEGSLYEYMQDKGHKPVRFRSDLKIERLPEEYCKIMQTDRNKKFMLFEYYGYEANGQILEYTVSYHDPEYTKFSFESIVSLDGLG